MIWDVHCWSSSWRATLHMRLWVLLHMRISHLLIVGRLLGSLSILGCKNALNLGSDFVVDDGLIVFTNDINAEFLGGWSVSGGVEAKS